MIDQVIGYFDPTNGFDPDNPNIAYRMNIWSSFQDNPGGNPNSYMPAVASFTGDVFSSSTTCGTFTWSDTGVDRIFPDWLVGYAPDDIFRMTFTLDTPVVLPSGVYFFSHDAIIHWLVDIKPGSDRNSINLKSKGVVPVAVLTTDGFDASDINPGTVQFAGATPVRCTQEDVDQDGDLDLLCHFKTQDLDLDENSTEATLTGSTYASQPVVGTDAVNIVPKDK